MGDRKDKSWSIRLGKHRTFVWPWAVRVHKDPGGTIYGGNSLPRNVPFAILLRPRSGMAGTMRYSSWTVEIVFKGRYRQIVFIWRPDVTHHWLIRSPRIEAKKRAATQNK